MSNVGFIGLKVVNIEGVEHIKSLNSMKNREIKDELHMTMKFKPNAEQLEEFKSLVGKKVFVKVCKDGTFVNNGKVENVGLLVDTASIGMIPNSLMPETPHITLWVGEGGKAVNTAKCDWFGRVKLMWVTLECEFTAFDFKCNPVQL